MRIIKHYLKKQINNEKKLKAINYPRKKENN